MPVHELVQPLRHELDALVVGRGGVWAAAGPGGAGHPGDPVRPRADPTVIRGGVQVRRPGRAARTGVGLGGRQEGSRPDPPSLPA